MAPDAAYGCATALPKVRDSAPHFRRRAPCKCVGSFPTRCGQLDEGALPLPCDSAPAPATSPRPLRKPRGIAVAPGRTDLMRWRRGEFGRGPLRRQAGLRGSSMHPLSLGLRLHLSCAICASSMAPDRGGAAAYTSPLDHQYRSELTASLLLIRSVIGQKRASTPFRRSVPWSRRSLVPTTGWLPCVRGRGGPAMDSTGDMGHE